MNRRFGVSVYKEKFNFCSAHFLIFANGDREELHGHNYQCWVDIDGPLDQGDLVIDFMLLKPIVKQLCDELDHRMILPTGSPHLSISLEGGVVWVCHRDDRFAFPQRDVILLPIRNTSTERLAEYLCAQLKDRLASTVPDAHIERIRVSVEESSGQCGYYEEQSDLTIYGQ
ncbi:MAG: 6-carboxytetrahydropterin synthase [Myxococcales bacterium]|nr:6-carboxytetrahydropterin synthase [Myxococcales bacterium]